MNAYGGFRMAGMMTMIALFMISCPFIDIFRYTENLCVLVYVVRGSLSYFIF